VSSLWRMLLIGFFCLPLAVTNAHQQTVTALVESRSETELSVSELAQLAKTDPRVLLSLLAPSSSTYLTLSAANRYLLLSNASYGLSEAKAALQYAEQGLAIPQLQQQEPELYYQLLLARAMAFDIVGTPAKGLDDVEATLKFAEQQQHTELLISALYSRGALYISLVNYLDALADLNRAYRLADTHANLSINKADVAGMLALVYEYRNEDALAIPYFTEAATYHRAQQNWLELSIALYGQGRAKKNIGELQTGYQLLSESATLARQIDDHQGVAYALKELASIAWLEGNIEQAKLLYTEALTIFVQVSNPYMLLDVNLSLARLLLTSEPQRAEYYLQQAKQTLNADSMPIQKLAIDETTAELLAKQGMYAAAYSLLQQTHKQQQQLQNQQSTEQLHQLRVQYELDSKEAENQLLSQQNQLQQLALAGERQRQLLMMVLLGASVLTSLLLLLLMQRSKKHKQRLEKLAETDALTAVYNRRKIMLLLQQQLDIAHRYNHTLSIAVLDLDWFKQINDTFGHQTGDEVLWRFAALCQKQLRKTDLIGRIGGEEFLVLFPCTDLAAARQLANRLCHETSGISLSLAKPGLNVTVSIGLACSDHYVSSAEILAAADLALYQAKHQGRNQVQLADPLLL